MNLIKGYFVPSLCAVLSMGIALSLPGHAAPLPTPENLNSTMIYGGESLTDGGPVQAADWGGGQASDSTGNAFTSAGHVIKVDTAGLYQGGQILFNPPLQLGNLKADKTRFLQFIMSLNPSPVYSTTPAASYHYAFGQDWVQVAQAPRRFFPPGMNGGMPGGMPGGGPPGGMPGPGPGAGQPAAAAAAAPIPALPIQSLHIIFEFADGTKAEMLRPVNMGTGDITWLRPSIPLTSIPVTGADADNAQLAKIYIGSDVPAELGIGEIRLVSNVTPIASFAGDEQTAPTNTPVVLSGTGDGGASTLKFAWDFDSPDHFVDEADGQTVTHSFPKAGDYKVILRVSDFDGLKRHADSTLTVHVTDQ